MPPKTILDTDIFGTNETNGCCIDAGKKLFSVSSIINFFLDHALRNLAWLKGKKCGITNSIIQCVLCQQ